MDCPHTDRVPDFKTGDFNAKQAKFSIILKRLLTSTNVDLWSFTAQVHYYTETNVLQHKT